VSWKHINFYGESAFRNTGEIVDLDQTIGQLIAHAEERKADADTSVNTN
jgi:hypothetical protein